MSNPAYNEPTVSVPFTLSELIELKADIESVHELQQKLRMNYSAGVSADILDKLSAAYDRYFAMLEEV